MNNYEERLKKYKEKLYKNYDIVSDLVNQKPKAARILYDPKDEQELRLAEAYLDNSIDAKNMRWAIANGVMKQPVLESNEVINLIMDYAINSIQPIYKKRSLNSFIEERFGTITPEVSAKIMYQITNIPKQEKIEKYVNKRAKEQGIKMTKSKFIIMAIAVTKSIIKIISLTPRVFKLVDTEQDIKNYEIYSRTYKKLCEEGLKKSIKDYWNYNLSKLDPETTYKIYNKISKTNKDKLAEEDLEEIQSLCSARALASDSLVRSAVDIALEDKYRIAKESSVSEDDLIKLIGNGIFSRRPIVETWFEIELFEDIISQPVYENPAYIKRYLKEAISESKAQKEYLELSNKDKKFVK